VLESALKDTIQSRHRVRNGISVNNKDDTSFDLAIS